MTCGIYILKFKDTDKVYIGQSKRIELRIVQHRALFTAGTASKKMQNAYVIHGMPLVEVLTECNEDELDDLEYEAISLYDSVNNGFNTRSTPGGGHSLWGELNHNSKYTNNQIIDSLFLLLSTPKLTYPEIFKISGVPKSTLVDISNGTGHIWLEGLFPKEYNLLKSYRYKRNTRFYPDLKSPNGITYTVEHLTTFCNEHSLDYGNMSKLLTGKKKQYLGWTTIPLEKQT